MLDAELAAYVVSFGMGMAVVALSVLAYARFAAMAFRQVAAVTAASLLIMLVQLMKVYDQVTPTDFSFLVPLYAVFSGVGFGLMGYSSPGLVLRVTGRRLTVGWYTLSGCVAAVFLGLGIWKELAPGPVPELTTATATVAVIAAGVVLLRRSLHDITDVRVRSLVRVGLFILPPLLVVQVAQEVFAVVPGVPSLLATVPFATLAMLLGTDGLLLVYGLRYLFRQDAAPACVLPEPFISRFNISPRECEIISMMVLGYSNRTIGEKLFISAITVKNHVYHIYRKTSAANKVQLLNLINSLK